MTEPLDILALGAHPDDAEVGCGGVLIIAADTGLRVGVADLTAGEAATRGTFEQRRAEQDRATEIMGRPTRLTVGLPDGEVGTDPGHRAAVIRLIREVRPTIVLAPYPEDRHPDHAAAGKLAREAAFLAGVEKVAADEDPPHRPLRVYHYMLHDPFSPTFVVDISAVWGRKQQAMAAYESQFGHAPGGGRTELDQGTFLGVIEARATFHGATIGVDRGEAFHYPGPLPLSFLPGVHDLGPGKYAMFH